ncbi:MAG: prepilin-type N-terminal cleavage/methylation domain-containing protein [Acidobacteriota bacterium]
MNIMVFLLFTRSASLAPQIRGGRLTPPGTSVQLCFVTSLRKALRARTAGRASQRGFTLIETLLGLSLVLLALVLGTAFLAQHPRVLERIEARRAAQSYLEDSLETLRAGGLELRSGEAEWLVPPPRARGFGLTLQLRVDPTPTENLYETELIASYSLQGDVRRRSVTTKLWRP